MVTSRGIYLNINESDYKVTYQGLTFYFTSKLYLDKFINKVKDFITLESEKFITRYGVNLNLDVYFMIVYYKKIEKRGFRIYDENKNKYLTKNVAFINQLICY